MERFHDCFGWHVKVHVDAPNLRALLTALKSLPKCSIGHLWLCQAGRSTVLGLAESGVRLKVTGFGRIDFDARDAIKQIYSVNPQALMFGTGLQSTRAQSPLRDNDLHVVLGSLGGVGRTASLRE